MEAKQSPDGSVWISAKLCIRICIVLLEPWDKYNKHDVKGNKTNQKPDANWVVKSLKLKKELNKSPHVQPFIAWIDPLVLRVHFSQTSTTPPVWIELRLSTDRKWTVMINRTGHKKHTVIYSSMLTCKRSKVNKHINTRQLFTLHRCCPGTTERNLKVSAGNTLSCSLLLDRGKLSTCKTCRRI